MIAIHPNQTLLQSDDAHITGNSVWRTCNQTLIQTQLIITQVIHFKIISNRKTNRKQIMVFTPHVPLGLADMMKEILS